MLFKMALVMVLAIFAARSEAKAPQIADATFVSVNVDGVTYQCTSGGSTGGGILVSGSYKNLAGNDLCPQSVRATVSGGQMTSVTVNFLSPCSGGSSVMNCSGTQCTSSDGNTLTVLGFDQYYFLNMNGLGARFQLN